MKINHFFNSSLLTLFPLGLLTLELRYYSITLLIMIGLFIFIAFSPSEKSRMLVWSFMAFFISFVLILYGYRIIESLALSPYVLVIIEECLQLIPMFLLIYVTKMFNHTISLAIKKHKNLLTYRILIGIHMLFLLISAHYIFVNSLSFFYVIAAIVYSILHSVLYEFLWRGILLELLEPFFSFMFTNLVLSLSFGIYLHNFGFPLDIAILFILISLGLSMLKRRWKSLLPCVFVHSYIFFLLIASGKLFIPIH